MLNIAGQAGIRAVAVIVFAHIGLETIPAAAPLRKLRRVRVGGWLGMATSV